MWEQRKVRGETFCKNKEIPRCHERREERGENCMRIAFPDTETL